MKIFLDDAREPKDCLLYMRKRTPIFKIYEQEWLIVRSYPEFVRALGEHAGNISHISFDHDLVIGHYHINKKDGVIDYESKDFDNTANRTGWHCAKYMLNYYDLRGLQYPITIVHSQSEEGTTNIIKLITSHNAVTK